MKDEDKYINLTELSRKLKKQKKGEIKNDNSN